MNCRLGCVEQRSIVHAIAFLVAEMLFASAESLFENEREPVNAKIYMHGDLSWSDFKIMISRSTTPDMAKTVAKIEEFLAQQHRNSIRALSSLRPQNPLPTGDVMSSLSAPVCPGSQVGDKEDSKDG